MKSTYVQYLCANRGAGVSPVKSSLYCNNMQ